MDHHPNIPPSTLRRLADYAAPWSVLIALLDVLDAGLLQALTALGRE